MLPKELDGLSSASLSDAVGDLFDHRCHITGLVSPTPDRVLWGQAATIDYLPRRADHEADTPGFADLLQKAVGSEPAGKVLVQSSGGHPATSTGGGVKLARLEAAGMAGILTDSVLRDFDELAAYRFATWCGGETPLRAGDVLRPLRADVPVAVGGVGICPGDHVYADQAGAVVIPAGHVEEVLAAARAIERRDAAKVRSILDHG